MMPSDPAVSSSPAPASIFPLLLTPMEQIFLTADPWQRPLQFQIRAHFQGVVQREFWEQACARALCRHPLLAAVVRRRSSGAWEWIQSSHAAVRVDWSAASSIVSGEPLELEREPGIRISVDVGGDTSVVSLQVHHACCDAMGALQFLADVRELYAATIEQRPPRLAELDARRLLRRGVCGLDWWQWWLRWPQDSLALLGLYEYWFHRPPPLGQSLQETSLEDQPQNHLSVTLSASLTEQLRNRARVAGATLNDLLVTALFETLHSTLRSARRTDAEHALRVVIPVNLRCPEDRSTSAANIVSLVFLDRRPGRYRTPQSLLRSVNREMWLCKLWNAGLSLVRMISWKVWFHGGRLPVKSDHFCLATAVLSNLGEAWDRVTTLQSVNATHPLQLTRLEFAPPTAHLVSAAFGVITVNGQLTVTLHHDRFRLNITEANELLERFEQRLRAWIVLPV